MGRAKGKSAPYDAVGARGELHKCSQCRLELPSARFPLRITTLSPYSVCSSHEWYWSDKKHTIWLPGHVHQIDNVCADLDARIKGTHNQHEHSTPVWVLDGDESQREHIVERIAATHGWATKFTKARKSRAVSSSPAAASWNYTLEPPPDNEALAGLPILRLTLTHNAPLGKWSLAARPDVPTEPGEPWHNTDPSHSPREPASKKPPRKRVRKVDSHAAPPKWTKGIVRGDAEVNGRTWTGAGDDDSIAVEDELVAAASPFDELVGVAFAAPSPPPAPRESTPPPPPPPPAPLSADTLSLMQVIEATLSKQPQPTKRRRSGSPANTLATPRRVAAHHVPLNYLRPLPTPPPAAFASTLNASFDPSLSLSYAQSPQRANPFDHSAYQAPAPPSANPAPLTLFQLLDSPFLSPPTVVPVARHEPSRLSRSTYDAVAAADEADDDLNSSDLESSGIDEASEDDGESSDEEGETEGEFINDEPEDDETGWEGDSASSVEESDEDEESEEGDWLEGFVKEQGFVVGGPGDDPPPLPPSRTDEVDELESGASDSGH